MTESFGRDIYGGEVVLSSGIDLDDGAILVDGVVLDGGVHSCLEVGKKK